MSSNSVRVSAELFQSAQEQGEAMTRSAAQQIEHWARLGKALEDAGLSTDEMVSVLRGEAESGAGSKERRPKGRLSSKIVPAEQMWAEKRAKQKKDMENVRSGKVHGMAMGWFSAKRINQVEILDSPY
ncbi:TA system antitoxin ParD family protein [Roseateles noduli]|uniref:TA system antitoxin ParD family protein n=1 Tax=Roseateles noduli TaxID=2052484 RepID=UPI003D6532C9